MLVKRGTFNLGRGGTCKVRFANGAILTILAILLIFLALDCCQMSDNSVYFMVTNGGDSYMRFISVRDLRNKPAQIRKELLEGKDIVLTSNGKPFAIVTLTSENMLETSLAMMRRIRAENAVSSIQKRSMERGTNKLSEEEINAEISAVRKGRK